MSDAAAIQVAVSFPPKGRNAFSTKSGTPPEPGTAPVLREQAKALGVTILGFGIGVEPECLSAWCDEAYAVQNLDRIDERSAEALFAR
jgi:hypothetical protein